VCVSRKETPTGCSMSDLVASLELKNKTKQQQKKNTSEDT